MVCQAKHFVLLALHAHHVFHIFTHSSGFQLNAFQFKTIFSPLLYMQHMCQASRKYNLSTWYPFIFLSGNHNNGFIHDSSDNYGSPVNAWRF